MNTTLRTAVVIAVTAAVIGLGAWRIPEGMDAPAAPAGSGFRPAIAEAPRVATRPLEQRTARQVTVRAEPVLEPGPTLYGTGDSGPQVREIQARLRQIAWFYGDVSDEYGDQTSTAISGFQRKRGIPVTGEVDRRTLDRLVEMTSEPTSDELKNVEPDPADGRPLHRSCTTGRAICVDKTSNSVRWVVDGDTRLTLDARFGGNGYVTREGLFSVTYKSRDHVSSLYDTEMPFAMFFSGGQAVHYSPDFAANGYYGASHGCVNIRDYDEIAWLYDQVQVGDKVVVYWS